jgi:hypothetical protein
VADLVKEALDPSVVSAMTRSLKGLGAGAGMGAAVGGLGGAAVGAAQGYHARRQEGGSVLQGLGGAAVGALGGAKTGLIGGAALGGAAGALRPAYAEALTPYLQGASHFGQRQVHALTGVGDRGYLRSIGGGAQEATERLHAARGARQAAMSGAHPELYAQARQEFEGAQKGLQAAEKAEDMGLTSLPGYARALLHNPKEALKSGFGEQWHGAGPGGKALLFGLPAAFAGNELVHGGKDEEGRGRFERAGRSLGQGLAYTAGPLSFGAQSLLDPALAGVGDRTGKFVDRSLARLTARRQPSRVAAAPAPEPAGGDTQAEGHIWSDRAAGNIPESMST